MKRLTTIWYQDATDDPDNPLTVVWKGTGAALFANTGFIVIRGGEYRLYGFHDPEWEPMDDDEALMIPMQHVLLIREVYD